MSGFLSAVGSTVFQAAYELSPIVLTGGIAGAGLGGILPLVTLTEGNNLIASLISGAPITGDNFFAHFRPLPGASLIENQIGRYPFANQSIAANAMIKMPLRVSLLMTCPVRNPGGYTSKLMTFTSLQDALTRHTAAGGTYTVATPSYIYTDCVLISLKEVGGGGGEKQSQINWQWDFEQPLISIAAADAAQNAQMAALSSGVQTTGATSGPSTTIGAVGTDTGAGGNTPAGNDMSYDAAHATIVNASLDIQSRQGTLGEQILHGQA